MRGLGLLLALGALVAGGCGGGAGTKEAAPPTGPAPPAEAASREPAPPLEADTLDGRGDAATWEALATQLP